MLKGFAVMSMLRLPLISQAAFALRAEHLQWLKVVAWPEQAVVWMTLETVRAVVLLLVSQAVTLLKQSVVWGLQPEWPIAILGFEFS